MSREGQASPIECAPAEKNDALRANFLGSCTLGEKSVDFLG